MPPKQIGIMGCGVVADYGHVPAIKYIDGIEVGALFEPNAEVLDAFVKRHKIDPARGFTDLSAFFDSGIDAVSICSPAPTHEQNLAEAAKRSLPVLCEKPLSMGPEDGERMIATAKAAGIPLAVGFCYRFSAVAQGIRRMIQDGAIGQVGAQRLIYNWDCHGKWYRPDPENQPELWAVDPRRKGRMDEGGPMVDCGVHQIDLASWWTGQPVARTTGAAAWVDEYEAPDHVWLHLDHVDGAHTCVEMSFSYGHTTRDKFSEFIYEIVGEDGMIRYERNTGLFELRTHQGTQRLQHHGEKDFNGMYAAFRDLLNTGEMGDLCDGETALRVTELARQATEKLTAERLPECIKPKSASHPGPGLTDAVYSPEG